MRLLLLSLALFIPAMSARPADIEPNFPRRGEKFKVDTFRWDFRGGTAIFDGRDKMLSYIQGKMSNDDVMVGIDPEKMQELEGTYVEVLTSRPLSCDSIKMNCHSFGLKQAYCHSECSERSSSAYSLVREAKTGNVLPAVFSGHYVCEQEGEGRGCFWLIHMDELVVLPKRLI